MNYILLVCVDAAWGCTSTTSLKHIPRELPHYHQTTSLQSGNKRAYIIGINSWLSASDADKKIMTESPCYLISTRHHSLNNEKIIQCATLAEAKHYLTEQIPLIDTVYIVGDTELCLKSLQSDMVTTVIIAKLKALFDCEHSLPELNDLLAARFFCASQTYRAHLDSVDYVIEEWTTSPPKSSSLSYVSQGLEYSLHFHPEVLQQNPRHESWVMVLKFIIGAIHQYCNPYVPQAMVFELIAINALKLFGYFITPEHIYSAQVTLNGRTIHEQIVGNIIERQEDKDWGWIDVLYENNHLNTRVLCLKEESSIATNNHDNLLGQEFLMCGTAYSYYEQGPLLSVSPLVEFKRCFNQVRGYLNNAQSPVKIISIHERIVGMNEVMTQKNLIPPQLDPKKLSCLVVGVLEDIGSSLYDELRDRYNLIYLTKHRISDDCFYIPIDFNEFESIFQIKSALPQLTVDIMIITSSSYSGAERREQPSYIFEETIQRNYLGPAFLLMELMNCSLVNYRTKIMILSSSRHALDSTYSPAMLSPEALFKEPEYYNPERQHAIANFAMISAIRYLFEHGFNIMALELGCISNSRLSNPQQLGSRQPAEPLAAIIELLATERFETFYTHSQNHESVSEAVLSYDCTQLWDYSRSLYFKIAHIPQKMRTTLYRPLSLWTWNILGIKTDSEALNLNKRMNYLLQKIYYEQPEVICLQEITQALWQDYLKPFSDKHAYRLSSMPADITHCPDKVFVATLTRLYPSHEELIELEKDDSGKDYYCLYQRYEQFELINVHLISGSGNQAKRMAQMKQILSHTEPHKNCIIMGDFNSDLNQTDLSLPAHAFFDIWHAIHPHQNGDTEDLEHNLLRKQLKIHDRNTQSRRVDGIFVHKELMRSVLSVERLGLEEVLSKQFISDHYGLTCTLEFNPL